MLTTEIPGAPRSVWTHLYDVEFCQKFIDVDGVSTRFAEAGPKDAPAVIMIHGTGGSWEGFCANLGALSEHFHCFALDMVGCGFSGARDGTYEQSVYVKHLRDFMGAVGVDRTSIIGCSMGAWTAASFAVAHPDMTDKIILVSTSGLVARPAVGSGVAKSRGSAIENPTWETVKPIFSNLILEEENRLDDLIAVRMASYRRPEMRASMANILGLIEPETWERNLVTEEQWRNIQAPAMVVAAIDKPDTYLEDGLAVTKLLPNAHLVEIKKSSHWAHFEAPEEFNRAAIDFLRS